MSPVAIMFIVFFALVVVRVPVAFSLGLAALLTILTEGLRPTLVVQQMYLGMNSFPLLAIPFFLLSGELLNSGLITDRLVRLAYSMVGHIRGGLAHITVVVAMIFAGMSGSSVADTAGVGSILIPAMINRNYNRQFAIALTASASTMGIIIPPSILMVIYGAMGGVSVGALFLAGAIPGALIGFFQMGYAYHYARRHDYPAEQRSSLKELGKAFATGFPPLLVPVIIIGGVISGQFTATEAGMVATVYVLFLILVAYRSARMRDLPSALCNAAVMYSQVLFAVAAATVFGWLLAYFEAPDEVAKLAAGITDSPTLTILFIVGLFLVVGTFLDAVPAVIIFMPIVLHLVQVSGANDIHVGLVVVMTMAMGLITPPYGLCLMLACAIGKERIPRVMPQMFIFYVLFLAVLLMVVLFPEISLFLPRLVMPEVVH